MTTTVFRRRMSVIIAVLGLAGATAAACGLPAASADEARLSDPSPLRCEIRLSETAGTTVIEGHVRAPGAASGHYALEITTRSRAGSSTIRQSGDFTLAEGGAATLGQTRLSGPASHIDAEMTLRSRGRNVTCAQARL